MNIYVMFYVNIFELVCFYTSILLIFTSKRRNRFTINIQIVFFLIFRTFYSARTRHVVNLRTFALLYILLHFTNRFIVSIKMILIKIEHFISRLDVGRNWSNYTWKWIILIFPTKNTSQESMHSIYFIKLRRKYSCKINRNSFTFHHDTSKCSFEDQRTHRQELEHHHLHHKDTAELLDFYVLNVNSATASAYIATHENPLWHLPTPGEFSKNSSLFFFRGIVWIFSLFYQIFRIWFVLVLAILCPYLVWFYLI